MACRAQARIFHPFDRPAGPPYSAPMPDTLPKPSESLNRQFPELHPSARDLLKTLVRPCPRESKSPLVPGPTKFPSLASHRVAIYWIDKIGRRITIGRFGKSGSF